MIIATHSNICITILLESLIEILKAQKRPTIHQVSSILAQARKHFEKFPNGLYINVAERKQITIVVCIFFVSRHLF